MKSSPARVWSIPLLSSLCVLSASAPAAAAVVWKADFEGGNLSEFNGPNNATKGTRKNINIVTDPVQQGKSACSIAVHPDDTFGQYNQDRVDMGHPSTLTGEGADEYLSGYYLMQTDAQVRNEFAFWESNVSFQNVMDFWVDAKAGGGTTVNFGTGFLGETPRWKADFSLNQWHQIAIHIHWSTDATKGAVSVWFDGTQVLNEIKVKTKADGNTLFFQTGLHRRDPHPVIDTIFLDNFFEGTTLADVLGAPPPDGGTAPRDASSPSDSATAAPEAGAGAGGSNGGSGDNSTGSGGTGVVGSGGATGGGGSSTEGSGGNAQAGSVANTTTTGGAQPTAPADDNSSSCAFSSSRPTKSNFFELLALVVPALAYRHRRNRSRS